MDRLIFWSRSGERTHLFRRVTSYAQEALYVRILVIDPLCAVSAVGIHCEKRHVGAKDETRSIGVTFGLDVHIHFFSRKNGPFTPGREGRAVRSLHQDVQLFIGVVDQVLLDGDPLSSHWMRDVYFTVKRSV